MKLYGLFIMFLMATVAGHAQNTINNYKYVIVPMRFDFSKEDNQYLLNGTSKMLLEQKGFTVFFSNESMPSELASNKCNALTADVTQKKSLFSTGLTLLLKDCYGNVVFKSKEGKSREKEFQLAYSMALREAFTSLDTVQYAYQPMAQPAAAPVAEAAPAPSPAPAPVVAATAAPAARPAASGTLYAQPIANGFQLIDTSPKKVLTLLKTSAPDYFIAEGNGIVFKKDGAWYWEYYQNDQLVSKKLDIKF